MLTPSKPPIDISNEGRRVIFRAIYMTIDNRDVEAFKVLSSFIYTQMNEAFQGNNLNDFENFSQVIVYAYEYVLDKKGSSANYRDIHEHITDNAPRTLKQLLGWGFKGYFIGEKITIEEKVRTNQYAATLINRFADLINTCLRNKDLLSLRFMLNQLYQSGTSYDHSLSDLKWQIKFKRMERPTGQELEQLNQLERQLEVEGFVDLRVQLLMKVSLFWSYFLYQTGVLGYDDLEKISAEFEKYQGFIESDFLDDLILLRTFTMESQFAWNNWDYTKRDEGVVYTPPSVHQWVTFGAVIYILRTNRSIAIDIDEMTPDQLLAAESLIASMVSMIENLKERGFEKWKALIKVSDEAAFKSRLDAQKRNLDDLQQKTITAKDRQIAEMPLDPGIVDNFIRIMCEGWKRPNTVNDLFTYFNRITVPPADKEKLLQVGVRSQVWPGRKVTLIGDEHLRIPVFGIEKHGQELADQEENIFLSKIYKEGIPSTTANSITSIDTAIQDISNLDHKATVILVGFYIYNAIFYDKKPAGFQPATGDNNPFGFSDYGGTYKEIPIIRMRSSVLVNTIIVADFRASFQLERKKDATYFDGVLNASVKEIKKEDAERLISENPTYWLRDLSNEEGEVMLMNAVLVDLYLLEDFLVTNSSTYTIIQVED
jgi:hypothetical protein